MQTNPPIPRLLRLALLLVLGVLVAAGVAWAGRGDWRVFLPTLGLLLALGYILRLLFLVAKLQAESQELRARAAQNSVALEESLASVLKTQRLQVVASLGAGLAHDFRNLLTIILGTTDHLQLRQEAGRPLEPEDLEPIRRAANRGRDLAQQLMALGRKPEPSSGQAFDLAKQVEAFLPLLERMVPKSVSVFLDGSRTPLPIQADPLQIEQVLVNLVANARDALPKGGRITIRTTQVQDAAGPFARIEVEDNGLGMDPSELDHIFEPFYTTKPPDQGTGLGLTSVKGIVEAWGGRIRASSLPGRGSTFTVDLRIKGSLEA